ncbi:MAG TPA: TolC family protein [Terracidiphilus sp.]|nr:TolC family protein [Terracidiphilus sp.]
MAVNPPHHFDFWRTAPALTLLILLGIAAGASAQGQNPTSAANPFYGSVTAQPVTGEPLKLSLDDAIQRGLKNNLGLREAENGEKVLHGEKNEALQEFLPNIRLTGDTGYYMHDLAALGFGPGTIAKFASSFPGGKLPAGFTTITRDDLTEGQIHFTQILFSGPVIQGWKAAGAANRAAYFNKMSARGEVVQQVATAYLRVIADQAQVDNAKALVAEAQLLLDHVHAEHEAGTAANLDELRARVQLESQQQALIAAQNQQAKDLILLKREIGIDPGQEIALTDPAPYSDLAEETPEEVRALAYRSRQDYQNLQNQAVEYKAVHAVYRSERLPSLSFNSYYGTSTVNGAGTHGDWSAIGTLSFPIFREARLRGDEDASKAEMDSINAQLADLRNHIDEQVRAALLDVNANKQLVDVARSNVDLATRALSDETDRVNAGVDDNLPLVTAQATLATAENNLVESLYQYNVSKLLLARAAGVLEQQYRVYLGH